ncbi:D-alanine--D-alanine ligase family protein [Cardinium endosymbiont of Nabis limbatus]|uniref:D-alanine--D-alanine ligase family protein n=1 Tax=Cardinium endosymbiont of Nabis limbatus TaxID=3066217 RepID=UPI003AF3AFF9
MRLKVGVLMGGFTPERHISLESGRNVYSKLFASTQYEALPLFLSGSKESYRIFTLPAALLLKDNADDIHDALMHPAKFSKSEALLTAIRKEAASITKYYAKDAIFTPEALSFPALKERIDFMFIALHGRPGEDGTLQERLEAYDIPYNGSGIATTALTIDKYATNQFLAQKGFYVAEQLLITKKDWTAHQASIIHSIEEAFVYPIIAKPVDDGCSAGVMRLTDRAMLVAYASASFRSQPLIAFELMQTLELQAADYIPRQERFLLEILIQKDQTTLDCLETTTGLLTHIDPNGNTLYELFEPSETVAADAVLSLEEKFLAGEGHNITPARFHSDTKVAQMISKSVKEQLQNIATALNLQGYARIDAFVKIYPCKKVEVWVVEINALPAMTPATCIFHQSALNGYMPFDFIDAIIQYGWTKKNFGTAVAALTLDR